MANIIELMQKAKAMKSEMEKVQKEIEKTDVSGESKKGLVKLVLNGKNKITSIEIDDSLLDIKEKDTLINHIQTAFNDANEQMEKVKKSKMKGATGGFSIPGLF